MNFKKYIFLIIVSVFFISACAQLNTSSNSTPMPDIFSNYDKTVDLDTQALMHIQYGLKIMECDGQSTADASGEVWRTKNNIQFVAVLPPGTHNFKIDLDATFYHSGGRTSYTASDLLFSHDFVAGHRYSLKYELYDVVNSKDKGIRFIITDRTNNPNDPEWPTFIKRLESL